MTGARPPEEAREGPVSPEFPLLAVDVVWRCPGDSRGMALPGSKPCSSHGSLQDAAGEAKSEQVPPRDWLPGSGAPLPCPGLSPPGIWAWLGTAMPDTKPPSGRVTTPGVKSKMETH